jgi:hypothetical protein
VYVSEPDVSVSVPLEGVAAKLNIASNTPTEQTLRAIKTRRLKKPDCEGGFFFMGWGVIFLHGVGRSLGQLLTVSENVTQLDASGRLKPTAAQQDALSYKIVAR